MDKVPAPILKMFGMKEDAEVTLDAFKEKVNEEYVKRTHAIEDDEIRNVHNVAIYKKVQKALIKEFKDIGVEIKEDEIKNSEGKYINYEDVLKLGINRFKAEKENIIKEYESKQGATKDEVLKEYESKLAKWEKKYNDEKQLKEATANEYITFKESVAKNQKETKLKYATENLWKNIEPTIKVTASPLEKTGFKTVFAERYKLDLDEQDNPIILDAKGERVRSKVKVSEFAQPEEVVESLRDELGLGNKNPDGGKETKKFESPKTEIPPARPNAPKPHFLTEAIKK